MFDDVPAAECPVCLSRSKANPPGGTLVQMRTNPKGPCVCGHAYAHHVHHDWPVGKEEPTSCQSCKCHEYETRNL